MASPNATRHNRTCGWGWCVRGGRRSSRDSIHYPDDGHDTGVAVLHRLHTYTHAAARGWSKADWIHRPDRTPTQR